MFQDIVARKAAIKRRNGIKAEYSEQKLKQESNARRHSLQYYEEGNDSKLTDAKVCGFYIMFQYYNQMKQKLSFLRFCYFLFQTSLF